MGIALAIVYPMQELFSGNQNIYFLWGMADLLPNAFAADPLLNSPDPYPLFSWLISVFPIQFLSIWTTILYVFLNSVYSFALFGIADRIAPLYGNRTHLFSFTALFLFLHSAPIWGTYFQLVFDVDLRWMWDSGIAEQGVLRGYLQPSVFGVFLLLGLYFAARRNYAAAILCVVPAATIHASYLFLGGILTVLFLFRSNFGKKDLLAAAVLLLLVLPYSYYIFHHFLQLDEGLKTSINDAVMAGFDQNIHINPSNWAGPKFYAQLIIMLAGVALLWKTQLRPIIIGIITIGTLLTALAYVLNNATLMSLNPWRVSILVMPIASIALLAKIVSNGVWHTIRPHILSIIYIMAIALIFYRIFGNGSADFLNRWKLIQIAAFVFILISAGFIFKNEMLNRLLPPCIILLLIGVGITDRYADGISKSSTEQFKVIAAIEKNEEPNTIYIIPPEWTSFRMNAQKSVFVDGNLVYGPALPRLIERLKLVSDVSNSGGHLRILEAIPSDVRVKLITADPARFGKNVERITDSYTCVTLR